MMKRFLLTATLLLAGSIPAVAGVSISVGEPGFYGSLDIGNFPRPMLVSPEPVIIYPAPRVVYEPIYMRVPPGHQKHWNRYCGEYNACGRPVYFVQDNWYRNVYAPRYQEAHWKQREHYEHEKYREEKYEREHEHKYKDHGHKGHGHGHD